MWELFLTPLIEIGDQSRQALTSECNRRGEFCLANAYLMMIPPWAIWGGISHLALAFAGVIALFSDSRDQSGRLVLAATLAVAGYYAFPFIWGSQYFWWWATSQNLQAMGNWVLVAAPVTFVLAWGAFWAVILAPLMRLAGILAVVGVLGAYSGWYFLL